MRTLKEEAMETFPVVIQAIEEEYGRAEIKLAKALQLSILEKTLERKRKRRSVSHNDEFSKGEL